MEVSLHSPSGQLIRKFEVASRNHLETEVQWLIGRGVSVPLDSYLEIAGARKTITSLNPIALDNAHYAPPPDAVETEQIPAGTSAVQQSSSPAVQTTELTRIWHYTMKYGGYGAIAGIFIKSLDTTIVMYSIDEITGNVWLFVVGSLFLAKKWPIAPAVPLILSFKLGVKVNLFIAFLSTMLVGALFGFPAGMIVGTIIGHYKLKNATEPRSFHQEGPRPYALGLALPLLALVLLIYSYYWFNLWAFKHLSQ